MGNPLEVAEGLDIVYTTAFPLGRGRGEALPRDAGLRPGTRQRGLSEGPGEGGGGSSERFNPEEYVFGIFLFYKDLITGQERLCSECAEGDRRIYLMAYLRWAEKFGLNDIFGWARKLPEFPEFLEGYRAAYWVATYRTQLHLVPEAYRDLLDPVVRKIADFQTERETIWMGEDGSEEEKSERVASLYARYQVEIGQELLRLGLPWREPAPSV